VTKSYNQLRKTRLQLYFLFSVVPLDSIILKRRNNNSLFLTFPSREHMSSFSLFSNCAGCCSMDKLLPEYFSSFLIQHYYQQRHVSWTSTFETEENLRSDNQLPDCWAPLHDAYKADNSTQNTYEVLPVPRANSP
jgi:hypothetical protein